MACVPKGRPKVAQEDRAGVYSSIISVHRAMLILIQAFVECIQTGEFMHVYNVIIVLKEILPFFPLSAVAQETGAQLDKTMDQFLEKEERGDLKILGRA